MDSLLNPRVISFDLLSTAPALVGLLTLGFGVFILVHERASRLGWLYLALAASVGLYAFGAGLSYAVLGRSASLFWDRVAHAGVVFIPSTAAASNAAILGLSFRYRRYIRGLFVVSGISLVSVVFGDLFISGNQRLFWAWYPLYGPLGWAFVALFSLTMIAVIGVFASELAETDDPAIRQRLIGLLSAVAVGSVGAVDFIPALGAPLYAFGFIPISLFVLITGFVILRYRLVDITPESAATPILRTLRTAVLVTDRSGIVRVANPTAHEWLGEPQGSLINRKLSEVLSRHSRPIGEDTEFLAPSGDTLTNGQFAWNGGDQGTVSVDVTVSELRLPSGDTAGFVYTAHDISAYKRAEERLTQLALHDGLTGLPNRTLLYERIRHVAELARRNQDYFAVLFIDLDGFKDVNDAYGHDAGDAVLQTTAQRLRSGIRGVDTVARMGGDEFVVLAVGLTSLSGALAVRDKIIPLLNEPIPLERISSQKNSRPGITSTTVGCSVGVALFPRDGTDPESLIQAADAAMYTVKRGRR